MALTPEDVINKRFQPTKFREGYDQDEVDDFLDEIVLELRRLNQENADVKQQLESADSAPAVAATSSELVGEETVEAEPAAPQPAAAAAASSAPETSGDVTQKAAGVLAMAQRLHDEYVADGRAQYDQLVADGQTQADHMVCEAQRTKDEVLAGLEQERGVLEQKVGELKGFEKNYREGLKAFISGQLHQIETAPSVIEENSTD